MAQPLAERLRPKTLDDYIGQKHLVGPGAVLRKMIDAGRISSFILWGPPGVGKTTLAQIIANKLETPFYTLSAVTSGVKDVREVIDRAKSNRFFSQSSPILFIDEIHRFSKSQQDSLLGAVENGTVTLIGATTENPSFEVIRPLLSRCQLYVLKSLEKEDLLELLQRAITTDAILKERKIELKETTAMLRFSGGDARKLLNILELVVQSETEETVVITDEMVTERLQQNPLAYDKDGEMHYDIISAFIKSIRGSDPDGAIYWLARMVEGGEDPAFIARRLVISAAEDIGLANPNALLLANACFDTLMNEGVKAKLALEAGACTKAVEKVIEANTLLSGIGFESGGLAGAHAIHNGFTVLDECHHMYHGEKVAFGTITQLVLEDIPAEELEDIIDWCIELGLPVTLKELGITEVTDEKLMAVATAACAENDTLHNMPFEVTPETVCAAIKAADAYGRYFLGE